MLKSILNNIQGDYRLRGKPMSDESEKFTDTHTFSHTEYFNRIGLTTNNEEAIFTLGMTNNLTKEINYSYSFAISLGHLVRLRDLLNRVFTNMVSNGQVVEEPKDGA